MISKSLLLGLLCCTGMIYEANQATAFSISVSDTGEENVELVLPWNSLSDKQINTAVKNLSREVVLENKKWNLSFAPETFEIADRRYVQFMDFELPLEQNDVLGKFGMVEKKILIMPIKPLLETIEKEIKEEVNIPSQDVTIVKKDGIVTFDGIAIDGKSVDDRALLGEIFDSIEQDSEENIDLPVSTVLAQVNKVGLDDLHVKELIATGVTDYGNSPKNRIVNIEVGLKRFNGVVIKQGAVFSFNDQLGPVDGKHGFLPELVILGPKTEKEFGGGLCQISSTMFQAALRFGLPITERKNHSYAVEYYKWPLGWGNDATIYPGVQDMKFVNDTPGDIIVQAYTEGTKVYYKFYGVSDHREVALTTPVTYNHRNPPATQEIAVSSLPAGKRVVKEKAHAGFTASFDRTVIMPDGTELKKTFVSVYQARPQIVQVGTSSEATNANPAYSETYYTGDISPAKTPTPTPVKPTSVSPKPSPVISKPN